MLARPTGDRENKQLLQWVLGVHLSSHTLMAVLTWLTCDKVSLTLKARAASLLG